MADATTLKREAAYPWLTGGADLFGLHKLAEAARAFADTVPSGPYVSSVSDSGTVAKRAQFTVVFQVAGATATNPYPEYDVTWNASGQTHQVEFSRDNFATTITRPAFWTPDYDYQVKSAHDWYYRLATGHWEARFTPPVAGTWRYRIRTTDGGGTNVSAVTSFPVTTSSARGRVRVATAAPHRFEYEDGTPFVGGGYNLTYGTLSWDDPVQAAGPFLAATGAAGVAMARHWLSDWLDLEDSDWHSTRGSSHLPYVNAATADPGYAFTPYSGSEIGRYVAATFASSFLGWLKRPPAIKVGTDIRLRVRYQTPIAMVVANGALPYGFCIKSSAIFPSSPTATESPSWGTLRSARVTAASGSSWSELVGTSYTVGAGEDFLPGYWALTAENCSDGAVYLDHVWLEENVSGVWTTIHEWDFGKPSLSWIDPSFARKFDDIIAGAEAAGVCLEIQATSGGHNNPGLTTMQNDGTQGVTVSEANIYGPSYSETAASPYDQYRSRQAWLYRSYARYCAGRWGHSSAVFGWQFVNEGAQSGRHGSLANLWCSTIKDLGDAALTTTSYPNALRSADWNGIPDADYLTIHAYQDGDATAGTDTDVTVYGSTTRVHAAADWFDSAAWIARVNDTTSALVAGADGRPVILDEGAMDTGSPHGAAPALIASSSSVAATYWRKRAWVGAVNVGGVVDQGEWVPSATLYPSWDQRALFGAAAGAVGLLSLNEGGFVDIAATCPTGLRAYGQKNASTGQAVIFVDNLQNTWKQVSDGTSVTPRTGPVSFSHPAGDYTVTPYDTTNGTPGTPFSATSNGTLSLSASGLSTDAAYLIEEAGGGGGSATDALAGSIVTDGFGTNYLASDGFGAPSSMAIDALVGSIVTDGFGTSYLATDGFGAALVVEATGGSIITDGYGGLCIVTDGFGPSSGAISTGSAGGHHRLNLGIGIGL